MAQWYVKDLSKLTQVTVQTLHHYDRIGLLKPSVRLPNGYRLYSEQDLLKLQQIIALKYFGFELAQIKQLLKAEINVLDHFSAQVQFLHEKGKSLLEASKALQDIVAQCSGDKSIPWEMIIKSIEVYRMTQELEKGWAGKVLTSDELKQYADFEQSLRNRFSLSDQKRHEAEWAALVRDVDANLSKDPASEFGISLGERCMKWVNNLYGKNFIGLRNAVWEKGFKGGHIDAEHKLNPKTVDWLDKAIDAYYRKRIMNVLENIGKQSDSMVKKEWEDLLTDMCGDEQSRKEDLYNCVLQDPNTNDAIKIWLKKNANKG